MKHTVLLGLCAATALLGTLPGICADASAAGQPPRLVHDVASGQIVARKSYDFRGDNDSAWTHAVTYMVRDLKETAGTLHATGR